MYIVSLLFKSSDLALAQHFKTFKNAEEFNSMVLGYITGETTGVMHNEDDFGSVLSVRGDSLSAASFTDVERDLDRNGQIQLLQHRAQLKTQNLASNDSQIKLLNTASRIQGVS